MLEELDEPGTSGAGRGTQSVKVHYEPPPAPVKRKNKWLPLVIVLLVATVAGVGSAVYFYSQYKTVRENQADPQVSVQQEVQQLLERVSELILLPGDEAPTVATVENLDELRDQPFFNNASVGDRVLIYEKARKAILYNPSQHKIIEVAPVTSGETAGASVEAPTEEPAPVEGNEGPAAPPDDSANPPETPTE